MSFRLKPCPFCGGEAVISGCDGGEWSVICIVCDASIGYKGTEREAIEAWNIRVQPEFTLDELDAIRRNVRGNCVLLVREFSKIEQSIIDKCNHALARSEE